MSAPGFDDFQKVLRDLASMRDLPYEAWSHLYRRTALIHQAIKHEKLIKQMLGEWVSGLEPDIAMDADGRIMGLTIADMPIGSDAFIVISAEGRLD